MSEAINEHDLVVCSALSGNRNFEGRIHPEVKMNYLASPLLVVAYAIAGRMDADMVNDTLGADQAGNPVFTQAIWPSMSEIQDFIRTRVASEMFARSYQSVYEGDEMWKGIDTPTGSMFE